MVITAASVARVTGAITITVMSVARAAAAGAVNAARAARCQQDIDLSKAAISTVAKFENVSDTA